MAQPAAQAEGEGGEQGRGMFQMVMQMIVMTMAMNYFTGRNRGAETAGGPANGSDANDTIVDPSRRGRQAGFRNLYGPMEECDLYVHFSNGSKAPPVDAALNQTLASEQGFELLWHTHVWYESNAASSSVNVSVGPLLAEALSGELLPYLHATLLRTVLLDDAENIPPEQVVRNSLPLVAKMKELSADAGAENLFAADNDVDMAPRKGTSSTKVPYFKTNIEIRPVYDHTVHSPMTLQQGAFRQLVVYPNTSIYQPFLYMSDFWLLEKDYLALNESLANRRLNLTLSYSIASLMAWSMQAQMTEQWHTQGEWQMTDTQRDSFMMKRLLIDTNPYLLAFSGMFLALHTVFSMLAFKNDIQFWRQNQSMKGLSARSMIVSFVCQLITSLYLLDSRETSRLILFEILLDTTLASWKLKKAVKVELKGSFPFIALGGQKGYEEKGTDTYDEEALRYMGALMTPLFVGYSIRSLLYGKHRGWYSFLVSTAAGGVYTFGFVMMTPQLYINYKLKSVEHLPWRALTYKAMNTFVDDIAALLIDMPMMHRLSCFRDDIVFFIYIFQRWKYRVDKNRPSIWVGEEGQPDGDRGVDDAGAAAPAQVADKEEQPKEADGSEEAVGAKGEAAAEASSEADKPCEGPAPSTES